MVSVKATVMVMALLINCLLATSTSAARFGCCQSYIKRKINNFNNIKGYSVQTNTGICNINAIIFHTKNYNFCTNPALDWVMDYVNRLRNKAQRVHNKTSQK